MSTDSEIIQRSLGNPRAFAELFDRHAGMLGGYAARRLGADAGQDILSETFLVAFARRTSFDTAWDSALPWLYGIASRLIRKHRATEAKHLRSSAEFARREELISHGDLDSTISRLDAELSTRELAPRIAALSGKERETLLLYAWGDLTYEEVAEALGVPVGTVRSRMNRIRTKLHPAGAIASVRNTSRKGEVDGRFRARA
ncbi:sigma-70 family RNA polymerase sigma factor [Microbacterium azadirachtae]|uniref:RNA polymerase sigma factor n=1 Tax=Microbacterium azadirachtae TaxID=582680 RepID=UPI000882E42D|nr:sigma-70 family RNA polymerase sigma factor [Microbacterium azadirachtae]UXW87234.1 sigma-70 family RNA polymerase sigma factor [Microbacterium azadirachtae]SDL15565.1 RNA polymerase sigma-70 factor, ECF subfamily [Microbacterium azadirachtae]SEF45265.1 RNA polymerase sigma-70 factor, ECF subfamily [Microbacterium azadirachtae]SEF45272.1 RNA polymerase sigma-70 factor, ECF subfamily [Microbacterium azadirachtae]